MSGRKALDLLWGVWEFRLPCGHDAWIDRLQQTTQRRLRPVWNATFPGTGPTSAALKAASSRNAMRHGRTNLHPVVTEADRPEHEALLLHSLQPAGFVQDVHFGDANRIGALHDLQLYQRFAKRNGQKGDAENIKLC